tara:strand:+ start:360 stop:533 length:174 start_codon:yes stop_codon:yes gene_type:complete
MIARLLKAAPIFRDCFYLNARFDAKAQPGTFKTDYIRAWLGQSVKLLIVYYPCNHGF